LANSLFHIYRFKLIAAVCLSAIAIVQSVVLQHYGFTWKMSILDSAISNILLAATSVLIVYTFHYYNPKTNRYSYIIGLITILTIVWMLVSRTTLMLLIEDKKDYYGFFSNSFPLRFMFGMLVLGCMALVSVLWYTIQEQQEIEQRKSEAEKLSKDAELFKLRQQLQPHFLFNSLNSINALITVQPQQARTMIQQLSDFLRGTLKKEDHLWISLEEELQHLNLYLEIEKVRFGHRLNTDVKNDAAADSKMPALLLQPVVENAIKFGLYDTTGDIVITIRSWTENNHLKVQVKNPFDAETSSPKKGTGFGLTSVQRRLYLLFSRNDLLETVTDNNYFITTITIPQ
jgi:two-component system, LytTR family, sensor kinase